MFRKDPYFQIIFSDHIFVIIIHIYQGMPIIFVISNEDNDFKYTKES